LASVRSFNVRLAEADGVDAIKALVAEASLEAQRARRCPLASEAVNRRPLPVRRKGRRHQPRQRSSRTGSRTTPASLRTSAIFGLRKSASIACAQGEDACVGHRNSKFVLGRLSLRPTRPILRPYRVEKREELRVGSQ
jgi:hypothetical protein